MAKITLTPLAEEDREQFILDNQRAAAWKEVERLYPDPHDPETGSVNDYEGEDSDGMFRFEKRMDS